MGMARNASSRSADPCTQVGAVAVDKDKTIIATGYNGLPQGLCDTLEAWQEKANYVVHAEENLLARAARKPSSGLLGATVYSTMIPCLRCTRLLIQAGVTVVIYENDNTTGYNGKWVAEQWPLITELFRLARVSLCRLRPDGELEPSSCNFDTQHS